MTILCIETSTSVCSAALCKDGSLIKQYINGEGSNHARLLPVYIEQLLNEAKEQGLTINAVALSEGPGSYTGLRIGTSTAKGLCYGMNVPLIPVPTLRVLEEAFLNSPAAAGRSASSIMFPMIDARRMEVYTSDETGQTRAVVVADESSLYTGDKEVYYFGDGAAKCQKVFTSPNWHYVQEIIPEARFVGQIAEREGVPTDMDIAYYEPYYLKEFIAAQSHVKGLR